ncbi:17352_t:CDS:2 [Cetraspora pellucida]|uniref:17352_t:CDS:1 n=1 Tax=Cetraspora pellucida TaxID=1433469 RepID=A0A9N8ZEP6_9GLOM|nr:17352_t:CDS:2 [Cetraspora pellucida]
MQSEIDETNSLKMYIAKLEVKNSELRKKFAEIEARNSKLKARIVKLKDKQTQNELIKNLLAAHKNSTTIDEFCVQTFFLHKTISIIMFHSDYKYIIDRLPESLVKRACKRLLHYSKDPVPLESISGKSERIKSYLRHTLEVYKISLNRKKPLPVVNSRVQTEEIAHDHEEENNCQKFMQDIERGYREWVTANKRLQCEVEDLKMQVQEAEKELTSMKSNSSY